MAVFIHHLFIIIFTFTVTKFKIIIEFFATIFAFFHTLFLHNFRFVTNMISYFFLNYIHLILIHCHSFCFCNQHPLDLLLQGFLCIFINRINLIYLDFFRFPVKMVKDFFPYLDGTYTLFFHEIIADNYKKTEDHLRSSIL